MGLENPFLSIDPRLPLLLFAMEFYLGHEPLRRYSGVLEHFRYSRYYFQNIWDVGRTAGICVFEIFFSTDEYRSFHVYN